MKLTSVPTKILAPHLPTLKKVVQAQSTQTHGSPQPPKQVFNGIAPERGSGRLGQ